MTRSLTHPWPAECDSRQAIQTRTDHSNRMVHSSKVFKQYTLSGTSLKRTCLPPGSTTNYISVSPVPDPQARTVDALSLPWEDLDLCAFPPAAILGNGGQVAGPSVQQTHTDCTRVVQHALVLGPGDLFKSDPLCLHFLPDLGHSYSTRPFTGTWEI